MCARGVGATFCSKTGRFCLCGPTKPFGGHQCSEESGPRSAAKQGRSLCVAPLKEQLWESMWPFSGGHILEKGPPPRSAKNVLQMLYLMAKFNMAKSGWISRFQVCLPFGLKPCAWDLESKNGPSSARVCPKGSGPRSAAKQAGSLCVAPLNHGEPMRGPSKAGPRSAAKQGCSLCVAPLNCLPIRPKPGPWDLESKNGPLSARVCPKGSGPRSAAKQDGSFCVAPLNLSGAISAPRSRGHVLQQNRVVLCVWPR